jgi:hypothetical protein
MWDVVVSDGADERNQATHSALAGSPQMSHSFSDGLGRDLPIAGNVCSR